MINIKYAMDTTRQYVQDNSGGVIYLPLKIGEFQNDSGTNSINLTKSYIICPETVNISTDSKEPIKISYETNLELLNCEASISMPELNEESKICQLERTVQVLSKEVEMLKSQFKELACRFAPDSPEPKVEEQSSLRIKDEVDILYLYSVPYVNKKPLKEPESMGIPIDHSKEIDEIIKNGLDKIKKRINFRMEHATIDSLRELSITQPKIALLSCHGDKLYVKNEYYLYLESSENLGQAEHVTEHRLRELFKGQEGKIPVECMIVSACHSEKIGKIMSELGVPVVIAIQADTKVRDRAAREFAKVFLSHLVKGNSYQDSFDSARNIVCTRTAFHLNYSCCCNHSHKPNCPEVELINNLKKRGENIEIVHENHIPKSCKCGLPGNIHRNTCSFLLDRS